MAAYNVIAQPAADEPVNLGVLYLRVSSKRQMDTDADIDPDGNSIDTQRKVCKGKARTLDGGVIIQKEFVEPGNSAQSIEKRPVFRELLTYLEDHAEISFVIVYMRSRAFRNYTDAALTKRLLAKMGVRLISAKEDFGEGIWADAMEAVTDIFNEVQVRLNGQDVKVKMANKARNGGTVGKAPIGYLNVRKLIDGHKVNTVMLDPERAKYIIMAFEFFATGDFTTEELHAKLTAAGLRMPATGRWPERPISESRLQAVLRDRYYIGEVRYEGVWYEGRHEALISEELFERVQRVLDSHSGAGTRERTHHHYLKGALWCARCHHRFIVQRATGNGGEYYYFLCRGRQKGVCDHPYTPVEVMEQAVVEYYGRALALPADFLAEIAQGVEEALADNFRLSDAIRAEFAARLQKLDNKEHYFLDLAAEEGWPKEKLREKIDAIRQERKEIRRSLGHEEQRLETGKQVFLRALQLLANPRRMYEEANELVRSILNQAFFARLYVDARKVIDAELKEPFAIVVDLDQVRRERQAAPSDADRSRQGQASPRSYHRRSGALSLAQTQNRDTLQAEDAPERHTLIDLLPACEGTGWSKAVMVGDTGIEPVTSTVSR
jgi:site-specific DNA recombinase